MNAIIDEIVKEQAKKLDEQMYAFLEKNGYKIERNNVEQITELRDKLAKEDKRVRFETRITEHGLDEKYKIVTHGLIFFDSISHPLSDDIVTEMIFKSYERKKKEEK